MYISPVFSCRVVILESIQERDIMFLCKNALVYVNWAMQT